MGVEKNEFFAIVITARSKLRKVLFLALSVLALSVTFCLFVNQISREPMNGFGRNSQGSVFDPSLGRV